LERFPMTNDISTMAKLAIAIEMNKNE
jgi:hypothetical protein